METMLQALVVLGGLTFSLAAALLIEELIFGQIVRVGLCPPRGNCQIGAQTLNRTGGDARLSIDESMT